MKTIKRIAATLMLGAALLPAMAEGGDYLHIKTADGWTVLDLAQVDRLTFSDGKMIATDAEEKTLGSYDREGLEKMYINETSGVECVTADQADATFSYDADAASVTVLADGEFEVFALDGAALVKISGVKRGEKIDLSGMQSGMVVMRNGKYSLKAMVK